MGLYNPPPPATLMQSVTQEKILILVTFNIIQCHIIIFYSGVDTINPSLTGESISIESMGIVYQQLFFFISLLSHTYSAIQIYISVNFCDGLKWQSIILHRALHR